MVDGKKRTYLRKLGQGETEGGKVGNGEHIEHLAIVGWMYKRLPDLFRGAFRPVYSEYAEKLIPRAIGYSAGLLNYFFRGQINMIPDNQTGSGYIIVNNSDEDMSGSFELYYDNTSDQRLNIWSNTLNIGKVSSGNNKSANISFTPPSDAKEIDKYMLVFRGQLGNETDAVVGRVISQKIVPAIWTDDGLLMLNDSLEPLEIVTNYSNGEYVLSYNGNFANFSPTPSDGIMGSVSQFWGSDPCGNSSPDTTCSCDSGTVQHVQSYAIFYKGTIMKTGNYTLGRTRSYTPVLSCELGSICFNNCNPGCICEGSEDVSAAYDYPHIAVLGSGTNYNIFDSNKIIAFHYNQLQASGAGCHTQTEVVLGHQGIGNCPCKLPNLDPLDSQSFLTGGATLTHKLYINGIEINLGMILGTSIGEWQTTCESGQPYCPGCIVENRWDTGTSVNWIRFGGYHYRLNANEGEYESLLFAFYTRNFVDGTITKATYGIYYDDGRLYSVSYPVSNNQMSIAGHNVPVYDVDSGAPDIEMIMTMR